MAIRLSKWGGTITAVSPYVVPPGGAVEQVNAQSLHPGQLSVRGGMVPVSSSSGVRSPILEMWGYTRGGGATEIIFAFTAAGELVQVERPTVEYPEPR